MTEHLTSRLSLNKYEEENEEYKSLTLEAENYTVHTNKAFSLRCSITLIKDIKSNKITNGNKHNIYQ